MVDWTTGQVTARAGIPVRNYFTKFGDEKPRNLFDTGRFQQVNIEGELLNSFSARENVEGSFSSSLSFRSPYPQSLEMSGNPVKFLQGHNLFGSDDYMGLFFEGALMASGSGINFPSPEEFHDWNFSPPRFTRLDITRSYRFGSNDEANAWLRYVGRTAHTRHRIRSDSKNGTVYFGKSSSRWSFKMYNKFEEITSKKKGHTLARPYTDVEIKMMKDNPNFVRAGLGDNDVKELNDWAEGVVRFELTIRAKEMEKYCNMHGHLMYSPNRLWHDYFKKIQFNSNAEKFTVVDREDFPNRLRHAVMLWSDPANDVKKMYSNSTFYRLRRELLEYKIDIAETPQFEGEATYSVPLELLSRNWDPKPISRLIYIPDPDILEEYGLGVLDKWAS